MRISVNWLREYVDVPCSVGELAERLTMAGLEVSAVERLGEDLEAVVVGQIMEKGAHPGADRLSLCRVTDGAETYDIVCGATNMEAGDRVALARVGTRLPGGTKIKKAKIRGQASFGMMCSERELGLSEEHQGILVLPPEAPVGQRLTEVLDLPDTVLEVDLTPNRADCLSVVGVAREVAAILGQELRLPEPRVPEGGPPVGELTSVEIRDPDLCHRYAARVIRGVRLGPSPLWLRQRLLSAGIRAINNVVDVTNYVLLELGHPLHAFDLRRLAGERIVVARGREGDSFTTLDGQDRILGPETLMICDAQRPVALAGIMGGLNSEVQDDTVDLLLESAYFLPENIRRTAKRLNLRTEASYRFERGTDIEGLIRALDRSAELIAELAGGEVAVGIWDAYPTVHPRRAAELRIAKVASVLGVEVSGQEVARHLEALQIPVTARADDRLTVAIPTHRTDLDREIDLIEEVARLRGYDSVPATLPRVPMVCEPLPTQTRIGDTARDALAAAGLRETVALSFVDPREDDRLALAGDSPWRSKVPLENPLSRETAVLRTLLLPGLLAAVSRNARRQARDVRLFEVGRTFHPRPGEELPREVLRAAGVLTGRRSPLAWWSSTETVDFYDVKGVVEFLFSRLGVSGVRFEGTRDLPWLHPGRGARILAGDQELGWLGQVHPDRTAAYEVPSPALAFEVDLEAATAASREPGAFGGLERFPSVERDVALVVDASTPAQSVLDAVHAVSSPLVRGAALFDVYEGDRIPAGKVSLAIRVIYRSDERTLTEEDVNRVEKALLEKLEQELGARLRQG